MSAVYWTPLSSSFQKVLVEDSCFSDRERIQYAALIQHFKKKGYDSSVADTMAQKILFQRKYEGLRYSEKEEKELLKAMKPNKIVTRSVATSAPTL